MAFLSKTLAALHLVVCTPAVSLKTCSLYVVQGGLWENGHIAVKLTIRNSSGYTRWDVSGTNRIHSSSRILSGGFGGEVPQGVQSLGF